MTGCFWRASRCSVSSKDAGPPAIAATDGDGSTQPRYFQPDGGEGLQVTQQGALKLISELNLREITGRGRFRAWGVFSQFSYTCCEGGQRRAEIRCGERRWIAKPEPATGNCFALIANDAQFRSTCDPSLDSHFGQQCNSHSEIDELHQCHDGCGVNITACLRWGGSYSSQDVFTKAMPSFQQKKWLALQIICINPVAIGQCMIASHRQIEDIPSNLCCREFIEFIGWATSATSSDPERKLSSSERVRPSRMVNCSSGKALTVAGRTLGSKKARLTG